jgi:hypothetical protein
MSRSRVVKYIDDSPIVIITTTAFQIKGKIKLEFIDLFDLVLKIY